MSSKTFEASSKFGHSLLSLYHERISSSENSAISPISVFICMYMLNHGANEETETEITKALCLKTTGGKEAQAVIDAIKKSNDPLFTMKTANGLFIQHGFEIASAFVHHLKINYAAHVENVKFGSPEGEKVVDDWVEKQTNGKIKDLLKGSTDSDTMLALVNAVYMKGKWAKPFNDFNTSKREFTTTGKQTVMVDFMHQTERFEYFKLENDNVQLAFFPYKSKNENHRWEMGILLPNNGEDPRSFLKFLEGDTLVNLKKKSKSRLLDVLLPKCRIEAKFDLIPILRKLGINLAFSDDADFSGISCSNLKVSKVFQKCFVDVDEKGTEAAAATVAPVSRCARNWSTPVVPIPFHAISPYLYFIRQPSTGVLLFAGIIANPLK